MTHMDKGKYFKKHPEGTPISDSLKQEILGETKDGNISCKAAEKIAGKMKLSLSEIGVAIDMLNINLAQCQLGLFGFDSGKRIVVPASSVSSELESRIRGALVNDRLPCRAAWDIAEGQGIKRLDVSNACEKLKIKVKPCQLGAF